MAKKISNPIDKHVGSRGVPLTEAFPWTSAPTYLVRDNDRAYGHVFTSRGRVDALVLTEPAARLRMK